MSFVATHTINDKSVIEYNTADSAIISIAPLYRFLLLGNTPAVSLCAPIIFMMINDVPVILVTMDRPPAAVFRMMKVFDSILERVLSADVALGMAAMDKARIAFMYETIQIKAE